jgi:hypothetical protein
VAGGSYSWTWTYSLVDPTKIFAVDQVTIKTNYGLHNGLIVSQTGASPTNPVPEPATLGMVGTGLLAAAGLLRRRYNL